VANRGKKNVEEKGEDERDDIMRLNSSMKKNVPNLIQHLPQHLPETAASCGRLVRGSAQTNF
jgi:hypothetical protein